jgi:hypothetical protein
MTSQPARGPLKLRDYLNSGLQGSGGELSALARLEAAGLSVAPTRIISAEEEERFYRLNNLPQRLNALFAGLDLNDPDEDDLEDIAPEAQRLIKTHYLLDEFIDLFYLALGELPERLLLRRPAEAEGPRAGRGRPALIALKNLWASEWGTDAVMARLVAEASVALEPRPVLIQPAGSRAAPAELAARAAEILEREVRLLRHPGLGITHALPG